MKTCSSRDIAMAAVRFVRWRRLSGTTRSSPDRAGASSAIGVPWQAATTSSRLCARSRSRASSLTWPTRKPSASSTKKPMETHSRAGVIVPIDCHTSVVRKSTVMTSSCSGRALVASR